MIGLQAAFFQQLLNIAQRQRISKIPADCTENERRFCLPLPTPEVSRAIRKLRPMDMWGYNDLAQKGELLTNGKRPLSFLS